MATWTGYSSGKVKDTNNTSNKKNPLSQDTYKSMKTLMTGIDYNTGSAANRVDNVSDVNKISKIPAVKQNTTKSIKDKYTVVNDPSGYNSGTGNKESNSSNGGTYSYSMESSIDQSPILEAYQSQMSDLSALLKEQQEAYEAKLREQQEAQRQAAQNAYNQNMTALEEAYAKRLSGLDSNLASTKDLLASSYGNSRNSLNASAEKALQEAYIQRMMNERSLRQQLNAQGLNGGASESAIASMLNNYGTARNNINTATADNLLGLEQTYNTNLADAQQKYNDAVSSAGDTNLAYKMQLESDLANNTVASYQNLYNALANMEGDYTSAMTSLVNNQANRNADLQNELYKAILKNSLSPAKKSESESNESVGNATDMTSAVNRAKQLLNKGYSTAQIFGEFAEYSDDEIVQIFKEAGIPF